MTRCHPLSSEPGTRHVPSNELDKYTLESILSSSLGKYSFMRISKASSTSLPRRLQDEALANLKVLQEFGPRLGRPRVDTLNGSRYANMKELRFSAADGAWRIAFAFDPKRRAIILCGGDKSGTSEARFYRRLIAKADERYSAHLGSLKIERKLSK